MKQGIYTTTLLIAACLALQATAQRSAAETTSLQTLEIKQRVLGPEHPDTLDSMSGLAVVCQERSLYVEAEKLNKQTLEMQASQTKLRKRQTSSSWAKSLQRSPPMKTKAFW